MAIMHNVVVVALNSDGNILFDELKSVFFMTGVSFHILLCLDVFNIF